MLGHVLRFYPVQRITCLPLGQPNSVAHPSTPVFHVLEQRMVAECQGCLGVLRLGRPIRNCRGLSDSSWEQLMAMQGAFAVKLLAEPRRCREDDN